MDAVLTDLVAGWLGGAEALRTIDDASVAAVREHVRLRGGANGLDHDACERLAAAASEVVHNQLRHAYGGVVGFREIRRGEVRGLEVIAADAGSGLADPTAAMQGGRGVGLGVGLSAAYRLADEMDVDVRAGAGTCVWLRGFAAPVPRSEVGVVGRAHPGEVANGDAAAFVRDPDGLVIGVVDGLGHGVAAHEAAERAVQELRARASRPLDEILTAIDHALIGTRGAVMAIARIDHRTASVEHAGAGNVSARITRRDGASSNFAGVSRTLGLRQPGRRFVVERVSAAELQALILYSDGLASRIDLGAVRDLLREPALVIADQLRSRHARPDDDVMVAVAR